MDHLESVGVANGGASALRKAAGEAERRHISAVIFLASTKVSTIPGISIAGSSPEATLYTPALDAEYLVLGAPRTMNTIPVTPEGLPTPALITRTCLKILGSPVLIVDAGSYAEPKIPHIDLEGRAVGGRIDAENALPEGSALKLYQSAKTLGSMLGSSEEFILVGESMPGSTTTAMAVMEALGFRALGRVSSASPENPQKLKEEVFRSALRRSNATLPLEDVFRAASLFGDPLHISIAGFAEGAMEKGSFVLLSGGTQMASVLAILRRLGVELKGIAVGTTRWIIEDRSSDLAGLVKDIAPEVPVLYTKLSFSSSRFPGLRAYEKGYVKEGVGAGGAAVAVHLKRKADSEELASKIEEEYSKLAGGL